MDDLEPLFKDREHAALYAEIRKIEQGLWKVRLAQASLPISVVAIVLSIIRGT